MVQQASSHKMELWASGFNAHNQLQRADEPTADATSELSAGEDILEFQCIATGDHIEVVYAGWCQTMCTPLLKIDARHKTVFIDGFLTVLGAALGSFDKNVNSPPDSSSTHGGPTHPTRTIKHEKLSRPPISAFGTDTAGLQGFINPDTNTIWTINATGTLTKLKSTEPPVAAIATTSAGITAVAYFPAPSSPTFTLEIYPTLLAFLLPSSTTTSNTILSQQPTKHTIPGRPTSLAATATGFLVLTGDGTIWSFGDARHPHILGRSTATPAAVPAPVAALVGCDVVKVVAGGWVGACVSAAGEAWLWGGGGPGGSGGGGVLRALKGCGMGEVVKVEAPLGVHLQDDGEEEEQRDFEVVDVAVGDGHLLMLDGEGRVWGCGRGAEGQLGSSTRQFEEEWGKMGRFGLGTDGGGEWRVNGVACGDLTSFVMLERVEVSGG